MTEGERAPLFSVLIPSCDRLDLLKHAVASALSQDFADFEIIVSDNASIDGYAEYVASLGEPRVHYIRTDTPLPVTGNWNRALDASRGQYIIMLGDDDALSPGYLTRAAGLIARFPRLDAIYAMAYHYAYPKVFPDAPDGFLATIRPRPIYDGSTSAYFPDPAELRRFGRRALCFRHLFGFNSQFFIWSRAFIDSVAALGPFFQSPYPDFYAAFVTMLRAERVLVTPEPGVIIGISPQSFGFYFLNNQLAAGNDMLKLSPADGDAVESLSPEAADALALPGSSHYRNWLIAALFVIKNLGATDERRIDYRRYRRIQLFETAYQRHYLRHGAVAATNGLKARLAPHERRLFDRISWSFGAMRRSPHFAPQATHDALFALYGIYADASAVTHHAIERHEHITDAWNWLARGDRSPDVSLIQGAPSQATRFAKDTLIKQLREAIADRDLQIRELRRRMSSPSALLLLLSKMVARYLKKVTSLRRGNVT